MNDPFRNLSLRDAIRHAERLGVSVYRSTAGEITFDFHDGAPKNRSNQHRKDCPRIIAGKLRRVWKAQRRGGSTP